MRNILVIKIALIAILLGLIGLGLSVGNAEAQQCWEEWDYTDIFFPPVKITKCAAGVLPPPKGVDSHFPETGNEYCPANTTTYYTFRIYNDTSGHVTYRFNDGYSSRHLGPYEHMDYGFPRFVSENCGRDKANFAPPKIGYTVEQQPIGYDGKGFWFNKATWTVYRLAYTDNRVLKFQRIPNIPLAVHLYGAEYRGCVSCKYREWED